MKPQGIAVLGSTGNIGIQTLDVAKQLGLKIEALAGHSNMILLAKQILEHEPRLVVTANVQKAAELKKILQQSGGRMPEILHGPSGYELAATLGTAQTVVAAMVGIAGLEPVMAAAKAGKRIALANKETLVSGGCLVTAMAEAHGAALLPIDSEHSAIFQCLNGKTTTNAGTSRGARAAAAKVVNDSVKKVILTASGGPFRGWSKEQLSQVTPEQALKHPNWNMGKKVTIDSATLMNKGLEVIEACWLFGIDLDRIQPMIHPQSIVHSLVEYVDGSVMAQLGSPDMRIPIQIALTWPKRVASEFAPLDLLKAGTLTFEAPDLRAFPCLGLAYAAQKVGGTMPAVMNGANEIAVQDFLAGKISFLEIPQRIAAAMDRHQVVSKPKLEDILAADKEGRGEAV